MLDASGRGELSFIAIAASVDARAVQRDGRPAAEFTWEGDDEDSPISGRGWAVVIDDGSLEGRIYIHLGDDSAFRGVRETG